MNFQIRVVSFARWVVSFAKYLYDKENVACQEKTRHGSKRSYNEMQDGAKEGDE